MPRFLLTGGLDNERAALTEELATIWNDGPAAHGLLPEVPIVSPARLESLDERIRTGNWISQSNHFTPRQLRAVAYANTVVLIAFHVSQQEDAEMFKVLQRNHDEVSRRAAHHRITPVPIFDVPGDPLYEGLAQQAAFLRSQRLIDHRLYLRHKQQAEWEKYK
ncbi:MAG: hypothetical protein JWN82_295 [Candidatus Saccharibacteria bacterium]|nr:hypothetical protein [Candidatus Saccharibacteria bacterium]